MSRFFSIILISSFFSQLCAAQTVTVSEELSLRNDIAYEIIGELKGQLLLFRNQNTEYEVHAFDKEMNLAWEKELELDKKYPKPLSVYGNKDDFVLFYRFREKGKTILKVHKYDPGANLIDSTTVKDYGFLFFTPNFEFVQSEDRSKILVYFVEQQSLIKTLVFDINSMELVWEKTFSPEKFIYGRDFLQMIVDNDGNFHLVLEKENLRSKRDEHHFRIYSYDGPSDNLDPYTVSMRGKLTFDAVFDFDNLNKRLVAGGLYSEKNIARTEGYFFLRIPPRKPSNHTLTFTPFKDEFVSNLEGKAYKKNKGLDEISIQEIVLRRDGGILVIAERNRQLERRSSGASRSYYDNISGYIVDHYYDELCIFSIHPDGQTHWGTILHKKQYSQDDDGMYSSYFLLKSPSSLRFLFNDEIRYENTVSEYVLTGNGEYDRNSLLSTEKRQLRLRFRDALQVNAKSIIVPSERRNRLRLVRLEY